MQRRSLIKAFTLSASIAAMGMTWTVQAAETIKVGILHSLSGTMAISETSLKDMALMTIDEINAKGGVNGKQLEPVVVDPASNWPLFAEKARQLLTQDKVDVVFGCWTSVSRKSVLPVFEELNGLLFYPVQYEGEEMSPNVFYTGAAPNQQAIPAVEYLMSEDGGESKGRAPAACGGRRCGSCGLTSQHAVDLPRNGLRRAAAIGVHRSRLFHIANHPRLRRRQALLRVDLIRRPIPGQHAWVVVPGARCIGPVGLAEAVLQVAQLLRLRAARLLPPADVRDGGVNGRVIEHDIGVCAHIRHGRERLAPRKL